MLEIVRLSFKRHCVLAVNVFLLKTELLPIGQLNLLIPSTYTLSHCLPLSLSSLSWLMSGLFQSPQSRVRRGTNSMSGKAELGAVGQLQAEMLHLDLIDGADGYRGDKESSKASAISTPPVTKDPAAPVTMDTYRPKRPTTLNLFPIVPRTQV